MDIENILYKLKFDEAISDDEREFIKKTLFCHRNDEELNRAIRAFGFAYPPSGENIKIIEDFLQYKATEIGFDDIVRASAINVLCRPWWWGLSKDYLTLLKEYASENSDEWYETQIAAFSILGEYLYNSQDVETLQFVYDLFEERLSLYKMGTDVTLDMMYRCLKEAVYGPVVLIENYHILSPKDIDQNLIFQIRNILHKYQSANEAWKNCQSVAAVRGAGESGDRLL